MTAVVTVTDHVTAALTGNNGRHYQSPPQPLDQALALVQLLIGTAATLPEGLEAERSWSVPIAGGTRTVHLAATAPEAGPEQDRG